MPDGAPPAARARILWLDVARGMGILIVVAGHVFTQPLLRHAIFLFHMPLFFFLSGLMFRPATLRGHIARRAAALLVPYASFLSAAFALYVLARGSAAFAPPYPFIELAAALAYGGSALGGALAIAWFVPCLFWASTAYALAGRWLGEPGRLPMMVAAGGALALAHLLPPVPTPLGLGQVPLAFVFLWAGAAWRRITPPPGTWVIAVLCFAAGILWAPPLDMRRMLFGYPVVSEAVALGGVLTLLKLAQWVAQRRAAAALLAALGRAALVILFCHMAVIALFDRRLAEPLVFLLAVAAPYALYMLLDRFRVTRMLFLGRGARHGYPAAKPVGARGVKH